MADPLVGLSLNPGQRDVMIPSANELRALGPSWIRYLLDRQFQNFDTGQNWELDFVCDLCKDLGINILLLIDRQSLNENAPVGVPGGWGDANSGYVGRVADLSQKVANFYRGKIGAIEIFNEPDLEDLNIVPEEYGKLLAAVYPRIKTVNDLPVISAGICCGMSHWYLESVVSSSQGAFDGAGWHTYALRVDGYPLQEWGAGELRDSILRARAIAGKPLWITEIGAELAYNWPNGVASADAVAEYLKRAYGLIRSFGADMVAHAFWFTWNITTEGRGLVDDIGNRRAAWYAFQQQTRSLPLAQATITEVSFTPLALLAGDFLQVSITVKNNSQVMLQTQRPDPGLVYEEGDTFHSRGFPSEDGAFRVSVDFDGRTGIGHPYRWGLGSPLPPGETRVITGVIRLKNPTPRNFWAGLVQEQVGWLQDQRGRQWITVNLPPPPDHKRDSDANPLARLLELVKRLFSRT